MDSNRTTRKTATVLPRNYAVNSPKSDARSCACNASRAILNWSYDVIRESNICVDSETAILQPLKKDTENAEVFPVSSKSDSHCTKTETSQVFPSTGESASAQRCNEERVVKFRAKIAELGKQKISVVFVSGKEGYGRVKITVHERESCKCKKNGKILQPCFQHLPFFCLVKPDVHISLWWKPLSSTKSFEAFADILVLDHEVKFCESLKMCSRRKRNLWRELLCGSLPDESDNENEDGDWVQFPHYVFEYRNQNLAAKARSGLRMEVPFSMNALHDLRYLLDNGVLTLFSNKSDLRSLCSNLELYDVVVALNNLKNDEKTISIDVAPTTRLHLCETVRLDSFSQEV